MGHCKIIFHIINIISFLLLLSKVHGDDPEMLDATICNYATKALQHNSGNKLLNISLPGNLSGIQASVLRIRSGSLWERGGNVSSINIPSGIIPFPFVKRLAIVYQNLGNMSKYYYKVPGYSLVSPVIGFLAYDASNLTQLGHKMMQIRIMGDPISIKFSKIGLNQGNSDLKCVKFGEGGLLQFRNLSEGNICHTQSGGHFCIVVQSSENKLKRWVWWVIGFGVLVFGVILVGLILVSSYKLVRSKMIEKMEGESEKGVAFDVKWIGKSKMPSASMVRTQPALENGDIP
ncbi:uncharacterized protein LOC126685746 [Mercurialis annua]|uniref:uncharacterized protein LOC126685746 n=1 Tax=Mercurialis annua TaxID=3986 RepID=UPI0021603325|nr:uncharacterized protein LOC126685746 [Mercurialis annua]